MTDVCTVGHLPRCLRPGEPVIITARSEAGLMNVGLCVINSDGAELPHGSLTHKYEDGLHHWTWITDEVAKIGRYIYTFTSDTCSADGMFETERGAPRCQYERTYVLLPQSAGKAWALAVLDACWKGHRYTIGQSADDAGIGFLNARKIIAVNPGQIGTGLDAAWYEQHYPGVEYEEVFADTPEQLREILTQSEPLPPPQLAISFHVQALEDGLGAYLRAVKPTVVKLVNNPGDAFWVKAQSPTTRVIYRKVENDWRRYVMEQDPVRGAREFLAWLRPELEEYGEHIDYVEGLNETIRGGQTNEIERAIAFEVAFAHFLHDSALPVQACLINAGVDNPAPHEVELLLPAAWAAVELDGVIGCHNYWPSNECACCLESDWERYAGRWTAWDEVFRAHGLWPDYVGTEGGPVGHAPGNLHGDWGWRHSLCLDGDWERCKLEVLGFGQLARDSVPGREGRWGGLCLFSVGRGMNWEAWEYHEREMASLATALGRIPR